MKKYIIVTIIVLVSLFFVYSASPQLGKCIEVGIFCQETQCPVPEGLAVTITGEGFSETLLTQPDGYTCQFGSGLVDGTYLISFYWNGPYEYEVCIDCSQIVWTFDYCVPNPTITKHFVYDLVSYDPIVGLTVDLVDAAGAIVSSAVTDATGTVTFDGTIVTACQEYTLQWMWGGALQSEGPISFCYTEGELLECCWEQTNYLEPKS